MFMLFIVIGFILNEKAKFIKSRRKKFYLT